MKKSRFTEKEISYALKRANSGVAVTNICRQLGVSRQAFYQWRSKYPGIGMMQRRLRQIEKENQKLKRMVADLSLNKHIRQEGFSKAVVPLDGNSAIHISADPPMERQETKPGPALA